MSDFKKGDVVMLKSTGPKMTVTDLVKIQANGPVVAVKCMWFADATLTTGIQFPVEALRLV
jgi:uncharacterized protein YodC (DUF2158 family)